MCNYIEHFLILASSITGCISISAFASFIGIPIGITSSTIGSIFFATVAGIEKYKSIIIKKQKQKHDEIVLLAKSKLNTIEGFISKTLIDSNISHDDLLSYCLNCRKNTESKNLKTVKIKKWKNNACIKICCELIAKNQNLSKSKKLADY